MAVQIRTPLPVYSTGTVAGNAGSPVLTGTSTNWTTTDTGGNTVNSIMGGDLFIAPSQAIPIRSVDSATQITLEIPLPSSLNAGSAYRIVKVSANLTGGVTSALIALMNQGSDAVPDLSRTIDSGAGRIKIRVAANGDLQVAVGPSGATDSALVTAIEITQGGQIFFPAGNAYLTADFKSAMEANTPGWVDQLYTCAAVINPNQGDPGLITFNRPFARQGGKFETLVSTWMQTATASGGLGYTSTQASTTIASLRAAALQLAG